jgi:hypothetical protein
MRLIMQVEREELFRMMSPEQAEMRAEREAIMLVEGASFNDVERCCNGQPAMYGFVGRVEKQDILF